MAISKKHIQLAVERYRAAKIASIDAKDAVDAAQTRLLEIEASAPGSVRWIEYSIHYVRETIGQPALDCKAAIAALQEELDKSGSVDAETFSRICVENIKPGTTRKPYFRL